MDGPTRSAGSAIGRTFGKMFVLGAGVIAAAGIGNFLKGSVEEAREAQKVGAATEAIIKATGGAAKITADQVGGMSQRLSLVTGIDDEAIQSGANLLLTFKNVKNFVDGEFVGVFDRATASAVDLSAAGFGSIESASKTMGKALNDPVKGVTALSRAGVTFTEQQKKQIATMVESGNVLGAQNIILGEVESQVGGVAAATATSGEKAKVAFGNIQEQIGTALLPTIDRIAEAFVKMTPQILTAVGKVGPMLTRLGVALVPIASTLRDALWPIAKKVFEFLSKHTKVLALIALGLVWLVSPVAAVAIGLAVLYNKSATVRAIFAAVAAFVTGTLIPALGQFVGWAKTNLLPIFLQVVGIIRDQVIPIIGKLADFFIQKIVPVIADVAKSVANDLKPVLDQLVTTVQTKVLPGISKLMAKFEQARPTIQKVVEIAAKFVGMMLKITAAVLGKVLPVLIRLVAFIVEKVSVALGGFVRALALGVVGIIDFGRKLVGAVQFAAQFARGVIDKAKRVLDFFKELPGKIKAVFSGAINFLKDAGKALIQGLINGITEKMAEAVQKVRDGLTKIKNMLPGSPIKDGPLKPWNDGSPGKLLMGMLAKGIADGSKDAVDAAGKAVDKVGKKLKEKIATLRDSLATVRSDFASLVDPIASAFTGSLFESETAGGFITSLMGSKGQLSGLLAAFKTLIAQGLKPGFLYQLFQSGNAGLILDMANNSALAVQAGGLFGDVMDLSSQLGSAVAGSTDKGAALEKQTARLENKLDKLIEATKKVGDDVGDNVNGASHKGHRRGQ